MARSDVIHTKLYFTIHNTDHLRCFSSCIGPGQSHNQILGPVGGAHGGMNPGHHRKSNSNSVNSHAAVMSGKQQMGGANGGGFGNMKFVKPSELSLDLISPSSIRNMGIKGTHGGLHNQAALGGGPSTGTNNNQNMQNIL